MRENEHILLIDDELGVRIVMQRLLEMRGYKVTTASSGQEGLEKLKKERFVLILLDINMTGMSGVETLKKIREIDFETVIIMLTGEHNEETAKICFALGANNFITKPFDSQVFDTAVETAIFLSKK